MERHVMLRSRSTQSAIRRIRSRLPVARRSHAVCPATTTYFRPYFRWTREEGITEFHHLTGLAKIPFEDFLPFSEVVLLLGLDWPALRRRFNVLCFYDTEALFHPSEVLPEVRKRHGRLLRREIIAIEAAIEHLRAERRSRVGERDERVALLPHPQLAHDAA